MTRVLALLLIAAMAALAQAPAVFDGGVGNAASAIGQPGVSPGSLVSIFGTELAGGLALADSIPLATSLAGVTVLFNDVPAPLLFVSQGQINAQLPWAVAGSEATVVVRRNGVDSPPVQFPVVPNTPGLFTVPAGGVGLAIAINLDGSLAQPEGAIAGILSHPADIGGTVIMLGTGFGAVTPEAVTGQNSVDARRDTTTVPVVRFGDVAGHVLFSGLSPEFVGVNQLNVTILDGSPTGDAIEVSIEMGGVTSPPGATMAIR